MAAIVEKSLEETSEFFVPKLGLDVEPYIAANSKQGIHHVGRYQWAKGVLPAFAPKRLLDIACGAGYGSKILADALPETEIIGGDYDPRAVAHANETYSAPNLRYRVADITSFTSNSKHLGQFDAIVSFDTLEHLLHREIALLRIAENLTDEGVFLFSTPCGHSQNRLNPGWEHHKIEYAHHDLKKLLKRFFHVIDSPEDGSLFPNASFWTDVINAGEQRYLNRFNPVVCRKPIRV